MTVQSAQSVTALFTTRVFATGVGTNADSLPAGTLYLNGTANGATVTVTNISTGLYKAAVTMPTLAAGDEVEIIIAATVSTIADTAVIWGDTNDFIGSAGALTTVTTATNLTNAATAGDLTATMKTSVTTAATAATPTAAAVTGAVGSVTGNVGGSVASVTAAVKVDGTSALTESYAAQGAALTLAQGIYGMNQLMSQQAIAGTTLTTKKRDGSTTAKTYTLDSATTPTLISETT